MLFDDINFNYEFDFFKIPGSDFKNEIEKSKFYSPEEGFLRGNMFKNEYVPYKNMSYGNLEAKTEEEALLFKLMAYSFAVNDLNLYLDLNRSDEEAYNLYKKYVKELNELEECYVKQYGPLTITDVKTQKYDWLKNPWPWDNFGGDMYV